MAARDLGIVYLDTIGRVATDSLGAVLDVEESALVLALVDKQRWHGWCVSSRGRSDALAKPLSRIKPRF